MAQLEDRITRLVPDLPADMVIQFFQLGGRVSDVLRIANLSGPELAKAKLHLPSIRKALVGGDLVVNQSGYQELLDDLKFGRAVSILQRAVPEFRCYQNDLQGNTELLADLCERQDRHLKLLLSINQRLIVATKSPLLGARSAESLISKRTGCVTEMETVFKLMQRTGDDRLRIMSSITAFAERMLHYAGCSKAEIRSAGGTLRDVRTTYKRLQCVTPIGPFPLNREHYVRTFKNTLKAMADAAPAVTNLRVSIKSDLDALTRFADPTWTDIKTNTQTDQGAWQSRHWQKVRDAIRADA
jgi:hypothetical protein